MEPNCFNLLGYSSLINRSYLIISLCFCFVLVPVFAREGKGFIPEHLMMMMMMMMILILMMMMMMMTASSTDT